MNSHHKSPEVITRGRVIAEEICEGIVGLVTVLFDLLAQGVKPYSLMRSVFIGPNDQVIVIRVRWEKTEDSPCLEQVLRDDGFQHFVSLDVKLCCFIGLFCVPSLQYLLLIFPDTPQSPSMKERRPVDVVGQFSDGLVLDDPRAYKFGNWGRIGFPVAFKTVCPCL